jgi:cardiolipin synthase (CMP-forming)
LRDFRPSIFGKANTFSQIAAVFFVMLLSVRRVGWIAIAAIVFLRATLAFTIISAVHYVFLVQHRLRSHTDEIPSNPSAGVRSIS